MSIDRSKEGLPVVSASKIKTYRTCARQYKYKYEGIRADRPEDHRNIAALLGTALHKAIEVYYREGISATGTFQRVMVDTLEEWETNNYTVHMMDYYPRAMKVGKDILNTFNWSQFTPIEVEYKFTLPFPNAENPFVNITGVIDLLDASGMIVDHKSATYAPNQNAVNHDPQFILYAWAIQQIQGVLPQRVVWNHLRTARLIDVDVYTNYADKITQLIEDMRGMLINTLYPRKLLDDTCMKRCSFYTLCYGEYAHKLIEDEE